MRKFLDAATTALATTAIFLIVAASSAHAQAARTFVSGHGADTGGCGVTTPCRSFAYAITQTAAGGEIVVLDSAGYGSVTIAQSVTITNPGGVEAGITATSGTNAIEINPTTPTNITLRGLTIEGAGVGANGIDVNTALPAGVSNATPSSLTVIGCVIKDFANTGLILVPGSSGSGTGQTINLLVSDSFLLNNTIGGLQFETPGLTGISALIERTTISNNSVGINIDGSVNAQLVEVHAVNNSEHAINITGSTVTMKNSMATLSPLADVVNNGSLYLINNNQIGILQNELTGVTDGSNYITVVLQNSLQLHPQQ